MACHDNRTDILIRPTSAHARARFSPQRLRLSLRDVGSNTNSESQARQAPGAPGRSSKPQNDSGKTLPFEPAIARTRHSPTELAPHTRRAIPEQLPALLHFHLVRQPYAELTRQQASRVRALQTQDRLIAIAPLCGPAPVVAPSTCELPGRRTSAAMREPRGQWRIARFLIGNSAMRPAQFFVVRNSRHSPSNDWHHRLLQH